MRQHVFSRREALRLLAGLAVTAASGIGAACMAPTRPARIQCARFWRLGCGTTLDTPAIQRAIDAAATVAGRVFVPGGRSYLDGTLELRNGIDFHLADDATLRASTRPEDYTGGAAVVAAVRNAQGRVAGVEPAPAERAATVLTARSAQGLSLTGNGRIDGRAREFMTHFDERDEWWQPGPFRPNLAVFIGCRYLRCAI